MEYINEININEAIIHILDNNSDEPVLNKYPLELTEEVYTFSFKHIQRCLKDEALRYAMFNDERNIVKEISQEYLNGENNLINVSQELANQMFRLMRAKANIPSCDLLTVGFTTEYGAFIGIFKMDYIKNYMHNVGFIDGEIDINIIPQFTGLPSSSSRIQKCAFIKTISSDNSYDLLVIDKKNKRANEDKEYGSNYFIDNYLGCTVIENDRDNTKGFIKGNEVFIRNYISDDAVAAEKVRSKIKEKLITDDEVSIDEMAEILEEHKPGTKESYMMYMDSLCNQKFPRDKNYTEKRLKRARLKIDRDIDLYISQDMYKDSSRFEITRNGDGSINMTIKNIINYIEK
ncbi:MAG TPA: nucleoid-associated protein [Clostridium sp.]|nr:nucleoid-associated protein [Clostridium sp.]